MDFKSIFNLFLILGQVNRKYGLDCKVCWLSKESQAARANFNTLNFFFDIFNKNRNSEIRVGCRHIMMNKISIFFNSNFFIETNQGLQTLLFLGSTFMRLQFFDINVKLCYWVRRVQKNFFILRSSYCPTAISNCAVYSLSEALILASNNPKHDYR